MPGKKVFPKSAPVSVAGSVSRSVTTPQPTTVIPMGGSLKIATPGHREVLLSKSTHPINRIVRKGRKDPNTAAPLVASSQSLRVSSSIFAPVDPNAPSELKSGRKHVTAAQDHVDPLAREFQYKQGKKPVHVEHPQPRLQSKKVSHSSERVPLPFAADDETQALINSGSLPASAVPSPSKRTFKVKGQSSVFASSKDASPSLGQSQSTSPPRSALPRYRAAPDNNTSAPVSFRPVWAETSDVPAAIQSPPRVATARVCDGKRVMKAALAAPSLVGVWKAVERPRPSYTVQVPWHTQTPRGAAGAGGAATARVAIAPPPFVHSIGAARDIAPTQSLKIAQYSARPSSSRVLLLGN
jgi:hypothetical protein